MLWQLIRSLWKEATDPVFRPLFGLIALLITVGGIFYWRVEKWSLLDSFYFAVITLGTVGYGDFSPETKLGKIFTIGYVLVGIGIFGIFINIVSRRSMRDSDLIRRLTGETGKLDKQDYPE